MYLAVVETIEDDLKDGADDHGDGGRDDEGVGGGEGGLLLLLGPDGAGQQRVPRLDVVICTETEIGNEQIFTFVFSDLQTKEVGA